MPESNPYSISQEDQNKQYVDAIEQIELALNAAKAGTEIAKQHIDLINQFRLGFIPADSIPLPDIEFKANQHVLKHLCPRLARMNPELLLKFSSALMGAVTAVNEFIAKGDTKIKIREKDLAKIKAAQDYRIKHDGKPTKKGRKALSEYEKLLQSHMKTIGKAMFGIGTEFKDRKKVLSDLSGDEYKKCKEMAEILIPKSVEEK